MIKCLDLTGIYIWLSSDASRFVTGTIIPIEGVNNLEKIVKVDGVDMITTGPGDLSGSIGIIGQTEHPKVLKLLGGRS